MNKIDSEDILIKAIGRFGKYQFWLLVFSACIVSFEGWAGDEYIYTTAQVSKRCYIPECDGVDPEYATPWILNAIPGDSNTSFEQCERYIRSNVTNFNGTCTKDLFDNGETELCDQFVYENENTVVYDFDLGCDEWKRSSLGSVRMIGKVFCFTFTGYVSDNWGRKTALGINLVCGALFGIARFWANSYYTFALSEFLEAMVGSGASTCAYLLAVEYVGSKYRNLCLPLFTCTTCIAVILQVGLAILIPNWRYFTLTLFSIMLVAVPFLPFINESIRWLISRDQIDKAESNIRKIAKINKKNISEEVIAELHVKKKNLELKANAVDQIKEPWLPVIVWRQKFILVRLAIASLWMATVKLVIYGLTLNSTSLSGNTYVNLILNYVAAFVGYFSTIFILPTFKRRTLVCSSLLICGILMFSFILVPEDYKVISMIVFLAGRLMSAVLLNAVSIYIIELFPTKYRHSLLSVTHIVGQIGAFVAPLTPAMAASIWVNLPYALYGGFCLVSSALVLFTPETYGTLLPNTIEDICKQSTENN